MLMLTQTPLRIIAEPLSAKDHSYLDLTALSPVLRCELQTEVSRQPHIFRAVFLQVLKPLDQAKH